MLLLTVILLFGIATLVHSAPTPATIVVGNPEHGNATEPGTLTAYGGNVTQVTVGTTAMTGRWAGFYGVIQGGFQISDASANTFYSWTVTNMTDAVVYAANSSVTIWNLAPLNQSILPNWLTALGTDSYVRTFTSNETFSSPSISSIPNTPYTRTWQAGAQGNLKTYALMQNATNTHIWAGKAIWNSSSFKGAGTRVDYQILVPADSQGVTYTLYVELP